jgi:hypothetical protein
VGEVGRSVPPRSFMEDERRRSLITSTGRGLCSGAMVRAVVRAVVSAVVSAGERRSRSDQKCRGGEERQVQGGGGGGIEIKQ